MYRFHGKCHCLTVFQWFSWKPYRKKMDFSAVLSYFSLVTMNGSI
jgi:hypothetical protein